MLSKYLFFLMCSGLLLSGCGLETDDDDEDTDNTTSVQIDVTQNAYLPLTNGTTILYTENSASPGDIKADISYDVSMSASKGYPVYVASLSGGLDLDLYFRSTRNQIELLGIDGPVILDGSGNSVDDLRFGTPLKLIGNLTNQTTSATATAVLNGNSFANQAISISYSLTNTNVEFGSGDARLPTLRAKIDASLSASVAGSTVGPFPVELNFFFSKGLGIAQHNGNYNGSTNPNYDFELYDLQKLPNPIWFSHDGNPANNSTSTFTITENGSDSNMSTLDYRIVNQAALDSLGWLTVTEESTEIFSVAIETSSSSLPTELTSVQVLFEKRNNSGERLSGTVTLLP
jgi:hypothetical protein